MQLLIYLDLVNFDWNSNEHNEGILFVTVIIHTRHKFVLVYI
jgi:hypothetical protein